jgi:hypothetical protein
MSAPCPDDTSATARVQTGMDMRVEPRHVCPKLVRMRPVTMPKASFRLSQVKNVSAGGIALLLTHQVAPGALLEVELYSGSTGCRFARVVHCTKQEGGWLVGCTLNHSLSDPELEKFLG